MWLPALLLVLALASRAQAAEVRWEEGVGRFGGPHVYVSGSPGEASDVTVSRGGGVIVEDATQDLTAAAPCRAEGPHRVVCPFAGTIHSSLGDGPDRLTTSTDVTADLGEGDDVATSVHGTVHGGPGNDRLASGGATLHGDSGDDLLVGGSLHGGPGDDTLVGTGGADHMLGGPGNDRLTGGEGDDLLGAGEGVSPSEVGGAPGVDEVDGGPGTDTVLYAEAPAGVTVDLRAPAPEGDTLVSIESAGGSRHDDRLLGTDGDDHLFSTDGRDFIDGRGGDDRIGGGSGADRVLGGGGDDLITLPPGSTVDAGPGNDRLSVFSRFGAGPGTPAAYDCGPGRDVVMSPLWPFAMPASCERVGLGDEGTGIVTTSRPTRRRVPLVCPERRSCEIEVQWRRGDRAVDRRRVKLRSGRRAGVRSRAARRATAVRITVRTQRGPVTYGLRF